MLEIATENAFDFLSGEYLQLFANSKASPFQHPTWLKQFYAKLGTRRGVEPLIIVARYRPGQRLAFVLPLIRRRYSVMRIIEFADLGVCDYAAPICSVETFAAVVGSAIVCDKIRELLKPFDVLRIRKLSDHALPLGKVLGVTRCSVMGMSAHVAALYGPYAQWRADNMDASFRKELDKKARQLSRKGRVEFSCVCEPSLIDATLCAIREYRRFRFAVDSGDLLQQESFFEFYGAIAADTVLSRTYCLSLDKQPIAGVFGLSHADSFLVLLSGFDHATYKNFSIGKLLFEYIARDCIERGDRMLDFTIGDEAYKSSFGTTPTPLWMIGGTGSARGSLAGLVDEWPWLKVVGRRLAGGLAIA